jgi:pimeloyl-[acyl-carrier protein] methyl ester esterase
VAGGRVIPLHEEVIGSGPPLVLWHGWGSNLRIFDALRPRLGGRFSLHAVDLPGYGLSAAASGLEDVATLESLMATLPDDAVLLGWSLGGQWALRAALTRPQRIRALLLVHSTPRFVAEPRWPHGVAAGVLRQFASLLAEDPAQCLHNFLELQLRGSRGTAPPPTELLQSLLGHGTTAVPQLQRDLQRLADTDLRPQLASVRTPTLIVSGQHDRVTPPGASAALATAIGGAHAVCIPRAGHLGFLSHPEAFDAALAAFLNALPAAAA